jgi:hypothetical protein
MLDSLLQLAKGNNVCNKSGVLPFVRCNERFGVNICHHESGVRVLQQNAVRVSGPKKFVQHCSVDAL